MMDKLIESLKDRACDYREMARDYRNQGLWSCADSCDGKASGLFLAVRRIREEIVHEMQ